MTAPKRKTKTLSKGRWLHRLAANPVEKRFAEHWQLHCRDGKTLAYLLGTEANMPITPSPRDEEVAATVVQWLGSPVGQQFLGSVGFVKKGTTR